MTCLTQRLPIGKRTMNKELFISYLQDHGRLGRESIDELQELVEQYPYFQTARLLYLKSLKENNSISFPSELKTTSVFAGNRAKLLKLMREKSQWSDEGNAPLPQPERKQHTDILSTFVEPLLFEHIATTTPGLTVSMVDKMLEFEYDKELRQQEELAARKDKLPHELIQPQIIEYLQGEQNEQSSGTVATSDVPVVKKQMSLIEKFIEKNPRIVPKDDLPAVSRDLSEDSVKENEFITETLAEIYIKQKKYDKALQIYQKLSLKYPQKSIYFADQISKIENFIKND